MAADGPEDRMQRTNPGRRFHGSSRLPRVEVGEHRAGGGVGEGELVGGLRLAGVALDDEAVYLGLAVGGQVAGEGLADEV